MNRPGSYVFAKNRRLSADCRRVPDGRFGQQAGIGHLGRIGGCFISEAVGPRKFILATNILPPTFYICGKGQVRMCETVDAAAFLKLIKLISCRGGACEID